MKRRCSGSRGFRTWKLFLELPCLALPHLSFAEVRREREQWTGLG